MCKSFARLTIQLSVVAATFFVFHASARTPMAGTNTEIDQADPNPVDPKIIEKLEGTWQNELESKMVITKIDKDTGAISGTYQTKKDSGTQGEEYPLSGWVNTSATDPELKNHVIVVSFSVRWGKHGSVTAWNGYYSPKEKDPTIIGQWLLSRTNSNQEWDHILTGQDQFHRLDKTPKKP
jgi:hypothetical protein